MKNIFFCFVVIRLSDRFDSRVMTLLRRLIKSKFLFEKLSNDQPLSDRLDVRYNFDISYVHKARIVYVTYIFSKGYNMKPGRLIFMKSMVIFVHY